MSNLQHTVDLLSLLGDASRIRLMTLVAETELTVAELTNITELPQSRVSTHLTKLYQAGLVRRRKVGTSSRYCLSAASMPSEARIVWESLGKELDDATLETDRLRRNAALAAREQDERWPDSVAGQLDRHYSPGRTWEATACGMVGLLQLGDVLDIGAGDGALAQLLAARCRSVTCLDHSEKLMSAASKRLSHCENARFVAGDMHELPFEDVSFDQVLHFHVLTYANRPLTALKETFRVLRPGGTLALVTLKSHSHMDIAAQYSQVNNGFTLDEVRDFLKSANFEITSCAVTSRERQSPHFEVISAFARKPN